MAYVKPINGHITVDGTLSGQNSDFEKSFYGPLSEVGTTRITLLYWILGYFIFDWIFVLPPAASEKIPKNLNNT